MALISKISSQYYLRFTTHNLTGDKMAKNKLTRNEAGEIGDAEEIKIMRGLKTSDIYYLAKKYIKFIIGKRRLGKKAYDNFIVSIENQYKCKVIEIGGKHLALVKLWDESLMNQQAQEELSSLCKV